MSQSPRRLLNYTLLREIGRGGMATVWYAENSVGRKFAIKLLKPELVAEESSVAERFRNEAQIMVRLEHPAILRVEDFYEEGAALAIIMEYLAGHDLAQHVQQHGAIPEEKAIGWFTHLLDAFSYVHQQGYFHRDVKPSNLFLTDTGAVKVMDFGIAKIVGADLSLTQTDMMMGSPLYMSPEQILSPKTVDFRTDIYSLGVTLHALLTGKRPYNDAERSMFSIQSDIVQHPLPRLAHVSASTNDVIQRATQKEPAERFKSCAEFKQALMLPASDTATAREDETVLRRAKPGSSAITKPTPATSVESETVAMNRPEVPPPLNRPLPNSPPVSVPAQPATAVVPAAQPASSRLPLLMGILAGAAVLGVGGWFWFGHKAPAPVTKGQSLQRDSILTTTPPASQLPVSDPSITLTIGRGISFYKQNRFDSSLALLTKYSSEPAFADTPEAMTDLGIIYYFGSAEDHITPDLPKARQWLQKGVDAGYAKACYYLGLLTDGVNFTSVPKARGSNRQAVDLYKAGAKQGDAYAGMTLGELFLQRNVHLRDADPCLIKKYLQQAVAGQVPDAGVALSALKKQGYCQ